MKYSILGAVALTAVVGTAHAATFTYDFKTEANASGQIGEAIFQKFDTSKNGVFTGPNLEVRATKGNASAFVYFDNGNAGMGVCGTSFGPNANPRINQYNPGSGRNLCDPGSDDGLTTTDEALSFKATDKALTITSFFINSNHDKGSIMDTAWNIGGTIYDKDDFTVASGGDVRIDVDYFLSKGDILNLFGTNGPNSYISAISVATVPLPATGMMLLAGLAGLGGLRAKRARKTA